MAKTTIGRPANPPVQFGEASHFRKSGLVARFAADMVNLSPCRRK
jgi:hypothetical protein